MGLQASNPTGPTSGAYRVLRGGSWSGNLINQRVTFRYGIAPVSWCYGNYGFRCAR